jgi:hypothetical protein
MKTTHLEDAAGQTEPPPLTLGPKLHEGNARKALGAGSAERAKPAAHLVNNGKARTIIEAYELKLSRVER